jgi:eukaryotic-like serine/threonine-protein kinase
MTERQWQEAWEIFRTARDLPEDERPAFLTSVEIDPDVMGEVVSMLNEAADQLTPESTSRVGTRFGRYEIVGILGSGGMGRVYSARDPDLGRMVAIKFLAPELTASRPAVERLAREAKAASALNHPQIVTVHEVIRAADDIGIVMELIEGTSLRSLCGEPQEVSHVIQWGREIARALSAAHQRKIVHRDIKPENVMVRDDGILKVLDFGLARCVDRDGQTHSGQSSTMLAGTLNYMAPEQTRAEPATSASDVFSLGLVLYELATGMHPFGAASPIDTAHAIGHAPPKRPSSINPRIPAALNTLLLGMLEKDPVRRPSAIQVDERLSGMPAAGETTPRRRWPAASLGLCLVAGFAVWLLHGRSAAPAERIAPLVTTLPGSGKALKITPFTSLDGSETDPAFSSDGGQIAFTWTRDGASSIYVKPIGPGEARRLTSHAGPDTNPAWSPDGQVIAFLRGPATSKVAVMTVPAAGGAERRVGDIEDTLGYPGPIAWMADGQSLVVRDAGPNGPELFQLSLATGVKRRLTPSKLGGRFAPSPDGRLLALERPAASDRVKICVLTLGDNAETCLAETLRDTHMAWSPDSRSLLLTNKLGLWRQFAAGGPVTKLADGKFDGLASDSQGRRLAFWRRYSDLNIWRIGTDGRPAAKLIASSQEDSEPEYSPDGSRILFRSTRSGNYELWVSSRDGSKAAQITSLGGHLGSGRWSPDGRQILFDAITPNDKNDGIWVTAATGGAARRLTPPEMPASVPGWSRDGQWVYFRHNSGIWKIPVSGGSPSPVASEEALDVTESPDGRFVYYRKGRAIPGIWRRPASGGSPGVVAGTETTFSRYWQFARGGIYFVDPSGEPPVLQFLDFAANRIQQLATMGTGLVIGPRGLTVSPDGRWILFTREDLSFSDIMLIEDFQ